MAFWIFKYYVNVVDDVALAAPPKPAIDSKAICDRQILYPPRETDLNIQSWVSTLSRLKDDKAGIADLHPEVFGSHPRLVGKHETRFYVLVLIHG